MHMKSQIVLFSFVYKVFSSKSSPHRSISQLDRSPSFQFFPKRREEPLSTFCIWLYGLVSGAKEEMLMRTYLFATCNQFVNEHRLSILCFFELFPKQTVLLRESTQTTNDQRIHTCLILHLLHASFFSICQLLLFSSSRSRK
jgi:hypothetical protein